MVDNSIDIKSINELIIEWNTSIEKHFSTVIETLSSNTIHQIIEEYDARRAKKTDIGFNVFKLITDYYYRENFHRDIIFEFLNPKETHNQGDIYLKLFLDMLNINHSIFRHAVVEKEFTIDERRRIDTLITDDLSKKAIIIENKMNNAGDMYRQLPDYYNYIQNKGYDVICIVYLPLLHNKVPDKSGWKIEEINAINNCLKIIPAFSSKGVINLCDNWLYPSINLTKNADCKSVLNQYIKLVKHLNNKSMDYVILEKFYENLKIGDNKKTAESIRNMLNDLPEYMASRIQTKYMSNFFPFSKIWIYAVKDAVFEGFILNEPNRYYKLDVWCNENGYDMYFWNPKNEKEDVKNIFSEVTALKDFYPKKDDEPNNIFLHLGFNEEEKVFSIIDRLLIELSALKSR